MRYSCPVCGYAEMQSSPEDDNICPCCGTHFGYHDHRRSHVELRKLWQDKGMPWFSTAIRPPEEWDPFRQVTDFVARGTGASQNVVVLPAPLSLPFLGAARAHRRGRRACFAASTGSHASALGG